MGAPDSWKTAEFNRQWGLEAISAEFAYARGYTGKGVTIGIIDNAILSHSEFAGKLTRLDNGSYNFSYDKQDNMSFGDPRHPCSRYCRSEETAAACTAWLSTRILSAPN